MFPTIGTSNQSVREAWLSRTLGALPAGGRILDAGAGEQAYKAFCPHLRYVAQDFGKYDGQGDASGLQTKTWDQTSLDIVSDISAIPEPDGSFDAIMCIEVLEHLPRPLLALREFSRLLRPGGDLVLTAPFCSLTHFSPYHFSSGYNRAFYESALDDHGFEILSIEPNGTFFEFLAQELRRVDSVASRYCGGRPGKLWTALSLCALWMLERIARRDQGSSELLCFGYHVLARKKEEANG